MFIVVKTVIKTKFCPFSFSTSFTLPCYMFQRMHMNDMPIEAG